MTQAAAVTPISKMPVLGPNQALLVGRIKEVRTTENACLTIIASPAPDAYSHPGQHEVISNKRLGKPGDDVEVKVQLAGYRRTYKDKHGDTIATVDNTLRAIED